jgi:hypothetical protein
MAQKGETPTFHLDTTWLRYLLVSFAIDSSSQRLQTEI